MAMSDTGSSFGRWAALYYHHDDPAGAVLPDAAASPDAAIGIAAAAAAASPTSGGSSGGSPTETKAAASHQHQKQLHGVEGPRAVGKPAAARRRSRASRRAPVTLLNTDTANFRAMVQQFTGIPAPPAGAFGVGVGGPVINFAGGDYGGFAPSSAVMSFDHQLHRSQHPAPLQEQLRRQQQQYTGASPPFGYSNGGGLLHGGVGDVFASSHGFGASAEDRMLLQSIQAVAQQMPPHMPPVSAAANTSSTNGFFA